MHNIAYSYWNYITVAVLLCYSQESRRGEMLVNRLMRQCQQERRIATQLMQIRKEKDVIRRNRCVGYSVVMQYV